MLLWWFRWPQGSAELGLGEEGGNHWHISAFHLVATAGSVARLYWTWCWAEQMGSALSFSLPFWARSATQSWQSTQLSPGTEPPQRLGNLAPCRQHQGSLAGSAKHCIFFRTETFSRGLGCSQDGLSVHVAFFHRWLQVRSFVWGTRWSWQLSYFEFIYSSLFSTRVVLSLP